MKKENEYKLCYVNDYGNVLKAYFTDNFEKQWGDDWDDTPYEHNAGEPYDSYFDGNKEYPIGIKSVYVENVYWQFMTPAMLNTDSYYSSNSPYSVEMINKGAIAWITGEGFFIKAGTTLDEFKKIIKEHNGKIYVEEE